MVHNHQWIVRSPCPCKCTFYLKLVPYEFWPMVPEPGTIECLRGEGVLNYSCSMSLSKLPLKSRHALVDGCLVRMHTFLWDPVISCLLEHACQYARLVSHKTCLRTMTGAVVNFHWAELKVMPFPSVSNKDRAVLRHKKSSDCIYTGAAQALKFWKTCTLSMKKPWICWCH